MQTPIKRVTIRRRHILMLLAGLLGSLSLVQWSSLFPQATLRVSVTAIVAASMAFFSWRLFRTRRIGLRTLVVFAPIGVAAICFPFSYVIQHQRMVAKLARAGFGNQQFVPNDELEETLGSFFELLFGNLVSNLFNTKLRGVHFNLSKVKDDDLASVPVDNLSYVHASMGRDPQGARLTENIIGWLNTIPNNCVLELSLAYANEDAELLNMLEHEVHSVHLRDQILGEQALYSILKLAPKEISIHNVGFSAGNRFDGVPAANVELLRIFKSSFSDSEIVSLMNATNPKILSLSPTPTISPNVFSSVFALKRLEGLSVSGPWVTMQHLETLSLSESLRWVAIQYSGISDEELEQLRAASPEVKINGRSARTR